MVYGELRYSGVCRGETLLVISPRHAIVKRYMRYIKEPIRWRYTKFYFSSSRASHREVAADTGKRNRRYELLVDEAEYDESPRSSAEYLLDKC